MFIISTKNKLNGSSRRIKISKFFLFKRFEKILLKVLFVLYQDFADVCFVYYVLT
jgi:hypothetical protein